MQFCAPRVSARGRGAVMESHFAPLRLEAAPSREEREAQLRALQHHISADAALPQMRDAAHDPVWGAGAPDADLLVLGTMPSMHDVARGEAFAAGSPENDMLRSAVARRFGESVYYMHVSPLRPYVARSAEAAAAAGDGASRVVRDLLFDEVCSYAGYVLQHVLVVRPRYVLALGAVATSLVRAQFAADRLLDTTSVERNEQEMRRARVETLDDALRVHEALRAERIGEVRGAGARDAEHTPGVYEFDLRHAHMRLMAPHRLDASDRVKVLTVASCGFACRTLVAEAPEDFLAVGRRRDSDGVPTLDAVHEWQRQLVPLDRMLRQRERPPIFVLEPNHAPLSTPGVEYATVPAYEVDRGAAGGPALQRYEAEQRVRGAFLRDGTPPPPSDDTLLQRFGADRPLLFQMNVIEYNQRQNCFEAFGRTADGHSVCARIEQPYFEFSARLLDWAWVEWLRPGGDAGRVGRSAAALAADVEWLAATLRTFFIEAARRTPHYAREREYGGGVGERWERFDRDFLSLDVEIVEGRSLYYITNVDEPFVRVIYRHKGARAAAEETVRAVLAHAVWRRARQALGGGIEVGEAPPRVEMFELDSDPVQQFCLRSNVTTSGWAYVKPPLLLVAAELRTSTCAIEVVTSQDYVGGVSPKCADAPRYGALPLLRDIGALPGADAFARETLPARWDAKAPYRVMSVDSEMLGLVRGTVPEPDICPVVSICAYGKTFDPRREALREQVMDASRRSRKSGCVDYDDAVVFALKGCGPIAPRLYEPETQDDALHAAVPGVAEAYAAQHAAYLRAIGAPPVERAKFSSAHLLAHFCQATLDDPAATRRERDAAYAVVGSRALQRYRAGVVDGEAESAATPWRRIATLLPETLRLRACRCGCARREGGDEKAALAPFLALAHDDTGVAADAPLLTLSRAERHVVIFLHARFDEAYARAAAAPRELLAALRAGAAPDSVAPRLAPPRYADDVPREKRWSWQGVADELCALLPELVEPTKQRLTWRLVGRVLPELLADEAEARGETPIPPAQRARRAREYFLTFLKNRHSKLAQAARDSVVNGVPLLDTMLGGAVWREPPAVAGCEPWARVLESLAAHTRGLVELGGLVDGDGEPLAGSIDGAQALSTWNAPPLDWLRRDGEPLLRRFVRLHPGAPDAATHLIFEPGRLLGALLDGVEAPPGWQMGLVECERGETRYARAEAAARANWYAFRPVPRVFSFDTEEELLEAFSHYSVDYDADVVTGYNILKFDYSYLIERARVLGVMPARFRGTYQLGRMRARASEISRKTFSSRAYGERELVAVSMPGRVMLDMFDYCAREKKWASYKLGYASAQMLGDTKDDVPYTVIYSLFMHNRERLHRYCLKDAELCLRMMAVDNVVDFALDMVQLISALPLASLYVRGQQARVVSLLLRHLRNIAARGGTHYMLPTQRGDAGTPGAERAAVSVAPDAARLCAEARARIAAGHAVLQSAAETSDAIEASLRDALETLERKWARFTRSAAVADEFVRVEAAVEEEQAAMFAVDADELIAGMVAADADEAAPYVDEFGGADAETPVRAPVDNAAAAGASASAFPARPDAARGLPAAPDVYVDPDIGHVAVLRSAVVADRGAAPAPKRPRVEPPAAADKRPRDTMLVDPPAAATTTTTTTASAAAMLVDPPVSPQSPQTPPANEPESVPFKRKYAVLEAMMEAAKDPNAFAKKKLKAPDVSYEGAFVFDPVLGLFTAAPIICMDYSELASYI